MAMDKMNSTNKAESEKRSPWVPPGQKTNWSEIEENESSSGHTSGARRKNWPKFTRVDLDDQPRPMTYDKFLIVKGTGGADLGKQSPFAIQKYFDGVKTIQRLRSGDYLIETKSEKQSNHFLTRKSVGDCLIEVKPHIGLNQIKGVIESEALKYGVTREEILKDLEDSGLIDCYFHQRKLQNGNLERNGRLTLTFRGQTLPKRVTIAGWLHRKVRVYIPNPLRCFQCQKFGHTSKSCKGKKRCANCGGDFHEDCEEPSQCINCGGDHAAFDRNCPQWVLEKQIQKVKAEQNISYNEAKQQVGSNYVSNERSFSAVTQSTPRSSPDTDCRIQGLEKKIDTLTTQINSLTQIVHSLLPTSENKRKQTDEETEDDNSRSSRANKKLSAEVRESSLVTAGYTADGSKVFVQIREKTSEEDNTTPPKPKRPSDDPEDTSSGTTKPSKRLHSQVDQHFTDDEMTAFVEEVLQKKSEEEETNPSKPSKESENKTSTTKKNPNPPRPGYSGNGKDAHLPPRGRGQQKWNQSKTGITKPKNGQKSDPPKGVTNRRS